MARQTKEEAGNKDAIQMCHPAYDGYTISPNKEQQKELVLQVSTIDWKCDVNKISW